ncbi:unnamed protein product [Rhizoctonia solani]|uniref:Jacalin-type lectin domain-containing protein n=1 Tax=Rhizoctonia solani TaxID=456999 RepID=A0A8H3CCY8_9AGAM|nr:unnamed protein product [Rhizoctonia solani]
MVSNSEGSQNFDKFPFLTGVLLDPVTGPFTMSRPVAVLRHSDTEKIIEMNESATEDTYSQNELHARYAQLGWPSPNRLPSKPGDVSSLQVSSTIENETWVSRRFMVQRVSVNLSTEDLRPVEPFVEAVEAALSQETNVLQIQAMRKVFATWGEVIPLNMVAGASLGVTGTLRNGTVLPNSVSPAHKPVEARSYDLADIVDQHLRTTVSFAKRLESRVQGGSSEVLLNEGYEAWLKSVSDNPTSWRVIKIHRVVPISDILGDKLRNAVERLFTNSLISRSPSVGTPHGFAFDTTTHSLLTIDRITIWFSDSRIRDISVKYVGGATSGPYSFALAHPETTFDSLVLGTGEYVTDLFVWHHADGWIAGIQFVKNGQECSPIYGIKDRESITTNPPAIWRGDVTVERYRHTQTSFTGSNYGIVFNDLQYLADPSTSRITQITARAEGGLANLRATYVCVSGGDRVRFETPPHGWDTGPEKTMILEEGEYITGARGSHNHQWMHQLQFITNKREHPPFGSDKGNASFSIDAPKTIDGKDMVLHYMAGKQ